ncbi:MAG: SBBP repeat-containing protein, partial [Acidobacteria bacterium]|nr:SBBP repeat-containing protein [Acidobacteriota bacterium]
MAKSPGLTVYFAPGEVLLRARASALRVRFQGAAGAGLEAESPQDGHANFLTGDPAQWRTGVPIYGGVRYRGLYPGIDLHYAGEGPQLKSEFVVAPGADPARIRIEYPNVAVRLDADGSLVIPLEGRPLREHAPLVYQDSGGRRVTIRGAYRIHADGSVGFELGNYDPTRALVIDPVLSYSTLLGGSGFDTATSIAVNAAGEAFVAGFTDSYNFPRVNAAQTFSGGGNDVFVARLNATGDGLTYATYIGGVADDRAFALAVDAAGSAYVAGSTTSRNFPTRNPLQARLLGAKNGFVLKLNPAGNTMVYSTYLGGNGSDTVNGIAVDSAGCAYVTGDTTSFAFPATGMQRSIRGGQDAFAAKLSADGKNLVYSTFLGGGGDDHGAAVAIGARGAAWIAGSTYSLDFPTAAAAQGANAGGQDAFVARLSPDGNSLELGTYLGGTAGTVAYPEVAQGIALDASGNAYVTGVTSSADFPLAAPFSSARLGSLDAFVTKITVAGAIAYSSYLGGTGGDTGTSIAVDSAGSAFVAGYSYSVDLPVAGATQPAGGGDYDAFVARIPPAGGAPAFLTYLGGNGSDAASGIAVDSAGNVYVTGWTLSTNFPLVNAYQSFNAGNFGAFVAKFRFSTAPVNAGVAPASGSGASQVFTLVASDAAGAADFTSVSLLIAGSPSAANACAVVYDRAQNTLSLLTDAGTSPGLGLPPGSGTQQNSQCRLNGASSSVTLSGNLLTAAVSLTFLGPYGGPKTVYMSSSASSGSTGWQAKGAWTVSFNVAAVSVAPASGSGAAQTFGLQFSDDAGANDLTTASILINSTASAAGACSVIYNRAANTLALLTDAGAMPAATISPGSGSQQNSQCVLSGAGSTVVLSGNVLTMNLAISFLPAFSGARTVYLNAVSPYGSTGWQSRGAWTVAFTLSAVSVSPSSGSGASQSFSFLVSDQAGVGDINTVSVLINSSASTSTACSVVYNRAANTLALLTDSGTAPASTITPGTGSQQNNQCSLAGAGSAVSVSGNSLTLTLALSFRTGFAGGKTIYLASTGGAGSTGWQSRGTWTVLMPITGGTAVSVTPNSGSGATQTFQVVASDPLGASDIGGIWFWFNNNIASAANNCLLSYTPSTRQVALADDGFTTWALAPAGQARILENSQCSVNAAGATAVVSGTQITVNFPVTFKPAFQGTWQVREYVIATVNSGWQTMGTWTVPAPSGAGTAVSVTPSSGSGVTQTFRVVAADPLGVSDIGAVWIWFNNNITSAANNCLLSYSPSTRQVGLANDGFTAWSTAAAGQ